MENPNQAKNMGFLIICGILLGWVLYLFRLIEAWQDYSSPYMQVACFYNYTLIVPIKGLPEIFSALLYNELTSFENLNFVIGIPLSIIGSLLYLSLPWVAWYFLSEKIKFKWLFNLYLAPAYFISLYWIFRWLFA